MIDKIPSRIEAFYSLLSRADTETDLQYEIQEAVSKLTCTEINMLPLYIIDALYEYDSIYPENNIWSSLQSNLNKRNGRA
jgi:hypothetical protein